MAVVLVSAALYFVYEFWPRPQLPGNPTLVGLVSDLSGNPISDATIGIYDYYRNPSTSTKPRYQATTSRNGRFRYGLFVATTTYATKTYAVFRG